IEDLSGSLEFPLFNEKKYLEYEKYLKENMFLYIKATVQTKYQRDDEFELLINEIKLLSEIGNEYAKNITLSLDASEMDTTLVDKLSSFIKQHPGKIPVRFNILDRELKMQVEANPKNARVNFGKETFEELEMLVGSNFRIN
ncbi:MAG TPA: hypothetical protein VIY47_12040, partial [Ignavibacteriaceae bacterium]